MRGLLVVMLGALAAAPVAAADQFDLICTAKSTSQRYRVDLARGEWCFGECKAIQKIAEVSPSKLVLARHEPQFARDARYYTEIDRTTGEWAWFYSGAQDIAGHCEPGPFSGLPAPKF